MINLHADDYGINLEQSRALLDLCSHDGSAGLTSMSIFANSPFFDDAAKLVTPLVDAGDIDLSLHVNLVEGPSCTPATQIPMLVDERGMMKNDFVKLLAMSYGPKKYELFEQLSMEVSAQIQRFLSAFPQFRESFRVDSHQHVHMIPVVFDALLVALVENDCVVRQIRFPMESLAPYVDCKKTGHIAPVNYVKSVLLNALGASCKGKLGPDCVMPAFCGVLLSGSMDKVNAELLDAFEKSASHEDRDVEVLFHPVRVPVEKCLDPQNLPFAQACASPGRDAEACNLKALIS